MATTKYLIISSHCFFPGGPGSKPPPFKPLLKPKPSLIFGSFLTYYPSSQSSSKPHQPYLQNLSRIQSHLSVSSKSPVQAGSIPWGWLTQPPHGSLGFGLAPPPTQVWYRSAGGHVISHLTPLLKTLQWLPGMFSTRAKPLASQALSVNWPWLTLASHTNLSFSWSTPSKWGPCQAQ